MTIERRNCNRNHNDDIAYELFGCSARVQLTCLSALVAAGYQKYYPPRIKSAEKTTQPSNDNEPFRAIFHVQGARYSAFHAALRIAVHLLCKYPADSRSVLGKKKDSVVPSPYIQVISIVIN